MRIICDAPGQTCNRLWTYVTSIARCVEEKKKMVILFYDWTIEDFPNLLHCPFIYFPLYQKWLLRRGNGWERYKSMTWKVTHNAAWDKIFKFFGCTKGWDTMDDARYLSSAKSALRHIYRPKQEITDRGDAFIAQIRKDADVVIGVHIRHGDYKTFLGGRFYYTLEEYHQLMLNLQQLYSGQRVSFFISSNAQFDIDVFSGCNCYRFGKEPSADMLDLYTLSLCDKIVGPWSTYSRWAAFINDVPLYCIKDMPHHVQETDFLRVSDFYHFENGDSTVDFWLRDT